MLLLHTNLICDVNETYTATPNTSLEPPSQANAKLADLQPLANIGVKNISFYFPSVDELRILALGLIPSARLVHGFLTVERTVRLRRKLSTLTYFLLGSSVTTT